MTGYIHSKETFGTVDGPGIRYVLFMQGCPMRCIYCHNPDTWKTVGGESITVDEVLTEFEKNRPFYSNGGITVSGGEPLLQIDFLLELFSEAKKRDIHTCIDTSGITFTEKENEYRKKLDRLMEYTDLVMLDIKHIDNEMHRKITSKDNSNILAFAKYLEEKGISLWVRHVVIEGYTDSEDALFSLGKFIGALKNLKALDVLPYHTMGVDKYKQMGLKYALEGVDALPQHKALEAKEIILNGVYSVRKKNNQ